MSIYDDKGMPEMKIPEDDERIHFYPENSSNPEYCQDWPSGSLIRLTPNIAEVTCQVCRARWEKSLW